MTLQEITDAVNAGKTVKGANDAYEVVKDVNGRFLIIHLPTGHCVGLHGLPGTRYENVLNGRESGFSIAG